MDTPQKNIEDPVRLEPRLPVYESITEPCRAPRVGLTSVKIDKNKQKSILWLNGMEYGLAEMGSNSSTYITNNPYSTDRPVRLGCHCGSVLWKWLC